MTSVWINIFRFITISRNRYISFNVKIRDNRVEIKNDISNRFVILKADYRILRIFKVSRYGRGHRLIIKNTWKVDEINSFINERDFDKMSYMIYFRIYKWLKSMLSVISSHKGCIISWMSYFVEFIGLNIQFS